MQSKHKIDKSKVFPIFDEYLLGFLKSHFLFDAICHTKIHLLVFTTLPY